MSVYKIENNAIVESFAVYPKEYLIANEIYKIRDLVNAGHDVESLGFYKGIKVPANITAMQRVTGRAPSFTGSAVEELPIVEDLSISEAKSVKTDQIKTEGLSRIQSTIPGIGTFEALDLVKEIWTSITPAARSATTALQSVIDIYSAGKTAIASVQALATFQEVSDYNPTTDPSWP